MPETARDGRARRTAAGADWAGLGDGFRGALVRPGHAGYDEARKVWNAMVDRRPAAIAYCAGPDDVARALEFARGRGMALSVRGAGHNVAGSAVCDDGLVIDLSRMKGVAVDPDRRVVRAEAGLNLGELDAATQAFGLATTMGVNTDTGMTGLTLGGGIGKIGRKHGLACDNLLAADVVTADGRRLRASADENADLFWGLRGGGGNFGIVTALEFRLHPVGPMILRAGLTYDLGQAREAMRIYHALFGTAPDALSADAALAFGPSGAPVFGVSVCYIGPVEDGARVFDRLLAPLRADVKPIDAQIRPMRYLDIQSAGDVIFPRGDRYYWKAQFLKELPEAAIDALLERFPAAPSRRSLFVFQHVGGAIARVPPDATAYVHRDAAYDSFPVAIWERPADDAANIAWAREMWAALRPFSTGGVYVNNLGEEGEARIRDAYGANHARLAALKAKYDPANVFRLNQNIRPAAS